MKKSPRFESLDKLSIGCDCLCIAIQTRGILVKLSSHVVQLLLVERPSRKPKVPGSSSAVNKRLMRSCHDRLFVLQVESRTQ